MKTYYIFRHGETFATKAGTGYGFRIFSAPLLAEAVVPLQKIGEYLATMPIDAYFSSAVLRCRQTAEIISAETKKEFTFDKRLNEYFLETFGHLRHRLQSLLTEIDGKGYEHVALCTHGACIAMLLSIVTARQEKPTAFNLFSYPPPGVLTVVYNNRVEEINFNLPLKEYYGT